MSQLLRFIRAAVPAPGTDRELLDRFTRDRDEEAFAASYLSLLTGGAFGAEYKDIFAFSILILILIFRPKGLLGEVVRERA